MKDFFDILLTEKQITDIKDKITVINLTDKDKVTLNDIYKIANRTPYQTGLLFKFCYDTFRRIDYYPLRDIIRKSRFIGYSYKFFEDVSSYPTRMRKTVLEYRMSFVINKHNKFITDVIDLMFGRFVGDSGGLRSSLDKLK